MVEHTSAPPTDASLWALRRRAIVAAMFGNVQTLSAPAPGSAATEALETLRRAAAAPLPSQDGPAIGARALAFELWSLSHGVAMLALAGHLTGERGDPTPADILKRACAALVDAAVRREQARAPRN